MLFAVVVLLWSSLAQLDAQAQLSLLIEVRAEDAPVAGARVTVAGSPYTTDAKGTVTALVPAMTVRIEVAHEGYLTVTKDISVESSGQQVHFTLDPSPTHEEEVTVSSTRTNTRIDDQPVRVEVLVREEIEEKMLMTPGDIVMMLNEMGGMRVQATSPALGAASVRVQGMRGRYTRVLSDGLPLFGEQPAGIGLLQIPPMDLGQVEVIKGVASALYGGGAMGGVIDLIARRPGDAPEAELLLNASTRGGTDGVLFYASPLRRGWGMTLLGGGHFQQRTDVNDDGWTDLPHYGRGVFRPRVFWEDGRGGSFFATMGLTRESRDGGSMHYGGPLDNSAGRIEAVDTLRADAGFVGQTLVGGEYVLSVRGAAARQRHDHVFGAITENDRHVTMFGELTLRGAIGAHTWVAGAAIEHDAYRAADVPRHDYTFTIPGVFVQDEIAIAPWWTVSASARADHHSRYEWFVSPRISSLVRGGGWTSRASFGTGFFGPTPLTEETEAAGLTLLEIPRDLVAERGRSFSLDVTRELGTVSATATFFRSSIRHPIHVEREDRYTLTNLLRPTTNTGLELLTTLRRAPFALTGTYTFVQARETHGGAEIEAALTPRHSAGIVAMAESEERGRVGLELYYTGRQRLDADPYRERSRPYLIVGVLVERRLGRFSLFVNGENLTDVRQTRWSPFYRPEPSADGRITVDAWAPLEGRTVNGGLRIRF
jgi:outer membrane receptor for ferrienterochelin and colicins